MKRKWPRALTITWIILIIFNIIVFGAIALWFGVVGAVGAGDDSGMAQGIFGLLLFPLVLFGGALMIPTIIFDLLFLIFTVIYLIARRSSSSGSYVNGAVFTTTSQPGASTSSPSAATPVQLPPESTEKAAASDEIVTK